MRDQAVYIVGAVRSPHAKAGGVLKDISAPYLASYLVRHLLDAAAITADGVDEVIFGNVANPAAYPNIGRVIGLKAGLDQKVIGHTVHRNCASGLEAVRQGVRAIVAEEGDLIVVGGVENMSQMPLMYGKEMTSMFAGLMSAKTFGGRLKALSTFRLQHLSPVVAIKQGLTDPFCGLDMGQTAEVLAREFNISREEQDAFAQRSHERAVEAGEQGYLASQIVPLAVGKKMDTLMSVDQGPRANSTMEKLAKLKPYFEPRSGTVTVGNSCPITDGGSALLLASKKALNKFNLTPLARIVGVRFGGLDPRRMGMGPLVAMDQVLQATNMSLDQMDLVEINEAFAAQVLAVLKGCKDIKVAEHFNVTRILGEIPFDKLNVGGGAIALGHPIGSTGARLLVTLLHEMIRRKSRFGLASLCIGGGQGGAAIIEREN